MGYMRHHTIVVTDSGFGNAIEAAHAEATKLFRWVSEISPPFTNGVRSFFIPPDGSKEGWKESNDGDRHRSSFIAWMVHSNEALVNTGYLDFCEVQFGDDSGENHLLRTNAGDVEGTI